MAPARALSRPLPALRSGSGSSYSALGPHGSTHYRWFVPLPRSKFLPIVPHLAMPRAAVVLMAVGLLAAVVVVAAVLAARGTRTLATHLAAALITVWSLVVEQPVGPRIGQSAQSVRPT